MVLLLGCGGPADRPAEPPPAAEAPSTDPGSGWPASPPQGWNPPSAGLEHQHPWRPPPASRSADAGPGWAWTWALGSSPDDWPGPAAVLASGPVDGATLVWAADGDPCEAPLPAAVETTEPVAALRVKSGASLVFVDADAGASHVETRRMASTHTLQVAGGVTLAPELGSLWPAAAPAHLVRWAEPPPRDHARLLHRILRRFGQRPVISRPPQEWTDELLADALLDGAVLEVDSALPPRTRALLERLRARPGWFGVRQPAVTLVIPAAAMSRGDEEARSLIDWLVQAAAALDAAHLDWDVTVVGDGEAVPWLGLPHAVAGVAALVSPPLRHFSIPELELLAARSSVVPLLHEGALPPWWPEVPTALAPERLAGLSASELHAALGRTLAHADRLRDRGLVELHRVGLPPATRVERHALPGEGRVVYHLRGEVPEGARLTVRRGMDRGDEGCDATVLDAFTGEARPTTCVPRPGLDPAVEVVLPASSGWTVVVVERRPGPLPLGEGRWTVEAAVPRQVEGRVVTFVPPEGSALSSLQVSLPEWLRAQDPIDQEGFEHALEFQEPGRHMVLTAVSEELAFRTEVKAHETGVDLELTVENRGQDDLENVRALICVSRAEKDRAWPFPTEGQDRVTAEFGGRRRALATERPQTGDPRYLELDGADVPVTELTSLGDDLTLSLGMDRSDKVGGNANRGICMHARPHFGDLAPGAGRTVTGRLRLEPGPSSLFELDWSPPRPTGRPPAEEDPGWPSPCSPEGTRLREAIRVLAPEAPP